MLCETNEKLMLTVNRSRSSLVVGDFQQVVGLKETLTTQRRNYFLPFELAGGVLSNLLNSMLKKFVFNWTFLTHSELLAADFYMQYTLKA